MVGAPPSVPLVPLPRRPPEARGGGWERVRSWYEDVLGWPTAPGAPVRLRAGVRFDVLDVPAEAGHAALERLGRAGPAACGPGFPVAVRGGRMWLFVAAGGADELPGLLEWLEWGSLPLDLTAAGAGTLVDAPLGPVPLGGRDDRADLRGAAVWVRPPEPGCEDEDSLPALSATGGPGAGPDLARLVRTLATQCHRVRLSPPAAR
ncbi:SCO3374 family protein [Streptomyces sp. BK79]|uniref:SCO3374 family protein n=1 Tax=Streptomyces sp. BK79 TaxID=3350097 RepID=UPI00377066CC